MKQFTSLRMTKLVIVFLLLFFLSFNVYSLDYNLIGNKGLQGEELVSVAVHPGDNNIIFVGTNRGLYKRNISQEDSWKPIKGFPSQKNKVNQILFSSSGKEGYIATGDGLYSLKLDSATCQNTFTKSDESERDCLSVCFLDDGSIFVGTRGGLFLKKQQGDWSKISSPFNNEDIVYLYGVNRVVYVSVQSGVYKSDDVGKSWEKIFNAYSYREESENGGVDSNPEELEAEVSPVKHITGLAGNSSELYVATSYGVFLTEDTGKNWRQLPLSGLDLSTLRFLLVTSSSRHILAVIKTGVYELKNEEWKPIAMAYDSRQIAQRNSNIVLITSRDIFEYSFLDEESRGYATMSPDELMNLFVQEPSIEEVQKMAIEYSEVSDKKIKDWRRRASMKALMPELSLDFDKTITTALGASYDRVQVGPMDWGVNLKWELSELIYNPDQTSIDTRSKLMVQLRNDILSEATRIYFERRKLQIESLTKKSASSEEALAKKLRLMELTALLDRLTGGYFSKVLNNNNK